MRQQAFRKLQLRVESCNSCSLSESRTNTVFGSGNPDADLMLVGEAPGYHEDRQGIPFVGRAGRLLDELLESIGLTREEVFIANVLKCRPPGNRDPQASEIEQCRTYLEEQVASIEPRVICSLGNFSTKLLSGRPDGITRVHGSAQPLPGYESVSLFPVFHPAAALYTPANLAVLKDDFQRLSNLLDVRPDPAATVEDPSGEDPEQLGLF